MTEDIVLPSKAKLKITMAPFAEGKALYQACLQELKSLQLDPNAEVDLNLFKDLFCTGFSSPKIDACLDACMKRVLYNEKRISEDTFEPVEAREDYLQVCLEVALLNLLPFTRRLSHVSARISEHLPKSPALKS